MTIPELKGELRRRNAKLNRSLSCGKVCVGDIMGVYDITLWLREMYYELSNTGGHFRYITNSKLENNNNIKLIWVKDVYYKI